MYYNYVLITMCIDTESWTDDNKFDLIYKKNNFYVVVLLTTDYYYVKHYYIIKLLFLTARQFPLLLPSVNYLLQQRICYKLKLISTMVEVSGK